MIQQFPDFAPARANIGRGWGLRSGGVEAGIRDDEPTLDREV